MSVFFPLEGSYTGEKLIKLFMGLNKQT